ncbi:CLUMA_CG003070, isoform A [Clunio marinus]|uniref:CLUMA_CG003070, isoform A n=1 Tax=Clunio marinus TaxID=568069 RepID=A0A1J1HMN3_9DIPT|nr:CLUMA_CG003070, isoform A [Clunio marinus]
MPEVTSKMISQGVIMVNSNHAKLLLAQMDGQMFLEEVSAVVFFFLSHFSRTLLLKRKYIFFFFKFSYILESDK